MQVLVLEKLVVEVFILLRFQTAWCGVILLQVTTNYRVACDGAAMTTFHSVVRW